MMPVENDENTIRMWSIACSFCFTTGSLGCASMIEAREVAKRLGWATGYRCGAGGHICKRCKEKLKLFVEVVEWED